MKRYVVPIVEVKREMDADQNFKLSYVACAAFRPRRQISMRLAYAAYLKRN